MVFGFAVRTRGAQPNFCWRFAAKRFFPFRLHRLYTETPPFALRLEGAKGPFLRVRWAVVRSLSTCSALPWRILVSRPLADRRRGAHHLAHLTDSCLLLKWCRYGVWWIFHPPLLQPARQPAQIAAMTPLSPDFSYGPSALSVNGIFDPPSPVESLVERRRVLVAPPFRALIKARASIFLWKRDWTNAFAGQGPWVEASDQSRERPASARRGKSSCFTWGKRPPPDFVRCFGSYARPDFRQ